MKNIKINKKNIIFLIFSCVAISLTTPKKHEYVPYYIITEDEESFAKYRNGAVYIGDYEYLESLDDLDEDDDVLVVDLRNNQDPDMKIINSYVIDNEDEMRDIISILKVYESLYPSNWDRTEETMFNEWTIHNLLHNINVQTNRTTDVDLNNADEKVYKKIIFKIH